MYTRILVPLDGSSLAERALPFAETLSRATGSHLLLIRAALLDPSADEATFARQGQAMSEARRYLADVVGRISEEKLTETAVLYGEAAAAILSLIPSQQVDLVIMTSHGQSGLGRWVLGTVADRVLRSADVPVLLIPAACENRWPENRPQRVLVPLDGSSLAEEALGPAANLAQALGAKLLLLRVVDSVQGISVAPSWYISPPPDLSSAVAEAEHYLERASACLREKGISVETRTAIGSPGPVIAHAARQGQAQVIAMTPHGLAGPSRLMLGRSATSIMQHARVPVLLVRPSATRDAQPRPGAVTDETGFEGLPVSVTLTPTELRLIASALENMLVARAHAGHGTREIQELLTKFERTAAPPESRVLESV